MYLYRALDKHGKTVESYLSRTRDIAAAKAFFRKALKHHGEPRSITLDGFEPRRTTPHGYTKRVQFQMGKSLEDSPLQIFKTISWSKTTGESNPGSRIVPMLGFKSFYDAQRVLIGIDLRQQIVKGQFRVPAHFGYTFDSIWQMVLAS
jgi:transposase-like protein